MIKWLKELFTAKSELEKLKAEYVKVLHEFKNYASKPVETKIVTIKAFEKTNRDFVKKLAQVSESEEVVFMLWDLKQQCVENMVNGNTEVNLQMTGILKGIDLVIKNLNGFNAVWHEMLKASEKNV